MGVEGRSTLGAGLSGQSDLGAAAQLSLVEERLEKRVPNATASGGRGDGQVSEDSGGGGGGGGGGGACARGVWLQQSG